ncbi:hypothetical protein [Mucilaginibacter sp. HD30]
MSLVQTINVGLQDAHGNNVSAIALDAHGQSGTYYLIPYFHTIPSGMQKVDLHIANLDPWAYKFSTEREIYTLDPDQSYRIPFQISKAMHGAPNVVHFNFVTKEHGSLMSPYYTTFAFKAI